jgi:hypothetical protein
MVETTVFSACIVLVPAPLVGEIRRRLPAWACSPTAHDARAVDHPHHPPPYSTPFG